VPLSNGQEPESPPTAESAEAAEEWLVPRTGEVPESRKATKTQVNEAPVDPPAATEGDPPDRSELAKAEMLLKRQAEELDALRRREAEVVERHENELAAVAKHAAELEHRAAAAEQRADIAERRARAAEKRTQNAGQGAEKRSEPPPSPAPPAPARENGQRLDVNAVRFEDLRGLGLSVTQSARLIATRDVRMGFESLKELEEIPDLPNEVVETLKRRLRV
jgi:DNA uptake protein ComE-like DNA-binding protein